MNADLHTRRHLETRGSPHRGQIPKAVRREGSAPTKHTLLLFPRRQEPGGSRECGSPLTATCRHKCRPAQTRPHQYRWEPAPRANEIIYSPRGLGSYMSEDSAFSIVVGRRLRRHVGMNADLQIQVIPTRGSPHRGRMRSSIRREGSAPTKHALSSFPSAQVSEIIFLREK